MSKKLSPWCKSVKHALIDKDMSITELADELGMSTPENMGCRLSPQNVFSRSANRGNANNVMNVNADGGVNNTNGWNSNTYAPIVFLRAL